MKLPILSVAGEALNFGARRMETIMRVAWLPIVLLLIVNMVKVYAFLTVIAGEVITFEQVPNFAQAEALFEFYKDQGWANNPQAMWTVTISFWVAQIILLSSFMAPLIRYSGLGERPSRGVVHLPFGVDQIRLIIAGFFSSLTTGVLAYGPLWAASKFVGQYIDEALSRTLAYFPNPDSLHQLEIVTERDALTASGDIWIFDVGIPWVATIPFAIVLWVILTMHFHPRNRLNGGPPNLLARAFGSGLAVAAMILVSFGSLKMLGEADTKLFAPAAAVLLLLSYLALRLFAYPGVAVARKSLAPGPVWRVTRGWNLLRLLAVGLIVSSLLLAAVWVVNNFVLQGVILSTILSLLQVVASSMTLISSGELPGWVLPAFILIWDGVKILINVFLMFFSYGVLAGLWGRLYRESERVHVAGEGSPAKKEIWRR